MVWSCCELRYCVVMVVVVWVVGAGVKGFCGYTELGGGGGMEVEGGVVVSLLCRCQFHSCCHSLLAVLRQDLS